VRNFVGWPVCLLPNTQLLRMFSQTHSRKLTRAILLHSSSHHCSMWNTFSNRSSSSRLRFLHLAAATRFLSRFTRILSRSSSDSCMVVGITKAKWVTLDKLDVIAELQFWLSSLLPVSSSHFSKASDCNMSSRTRRTFASCCSKPSTLSLKMRQHGAISSQEKENSIN